MLVLSACDLLIRYLWLVHMTCPFMNVGVGFESFNTLNGNGTDRRSTDTEQELILEPTIHVFVIAGNLDQLLSSDSLTQQIDFCLDKCNKRSENVTFCKPEMNRPPFSFQEISRHIG